MCIYKKNWKFTPNVKMDFFPGFWDFMGLLFVLFFAFSNFFFLQ